MIKQTTIALDRKEVEAILIQWFKAEFDYDSTPAVTFPIVEDQFKGADITINETVKDGKK